MSYPSPGSGRIRRQFSIAALAVTLAFAGLTLGTAPAQADSDPRPLTQGADWLSAELTNGLLPTQWGFDYGLSIDAALAFDAIGGHAGEVNSITDAVSAHVNSYVTGEDFGDLGSTYAGATAKAAVLAQVAGDDPTSFGGDNLVTRLEDRVATTAPIVGRIEDDSSYGDYANTLGQSFASRALTEAGSSKASDALSFLLKQQCSDGFFREQFTADKTAPDQTCDGDSGSPSIDTTAIVVLNLLSIPAAPGASDAISNARAWLLTQQAPDGSFGNANATGLSAWALGETPDAVKAAQWLRAHQADDADACSKLNGEVGAIALDDAGLADGRSDGLTNASRPIWQRAAAQALPALQYLPATTAATLQLSGPGGYRKARATDTFRVAGANPSSRLCLRGYGVAESAAANGGGTAKVRAREPAGTANRTFLLTDADGNTDTVVTKVLGAKRLAVKVSKNRVHRRHWVRVVVSGLAPGERVALRFRGRTVRRGLAWSNGRFVRALRVNRKLGRTRVVASGQFADIRRGSRVIRVIR